MNNFQNPSPPLISLTPSSQPKTRSRAGTLPSSLFSGRSSSTSPLITTTTDALGLPTMESLSSPQPALDQSQQQGRRMRSGSLFSTNSIWNDEPVGHSPQSSIYESALVDSNSQQQFLGVPDTVTPTGRNRSYTTNAGGLSNQQMSMLDSFGLNRVSPFINQPNAKNDVNALLDSLMMNLQPQEQQYSPTPRIRSQTFSAGQPPAELMGQAPINFYQQQPPVQFQATLQDDFDVSQVTITTNFDNPNLGPTKNIFLDNLPQFVDALKLYSVLSSSLGNQRSFGVICAVRVCQMNNSKLALVECSNVDTAMSLKADFNHVEFVPGVVLYVAFAKVEPNQKQPAVSAVAPPLMNQPGTPPKSGGNSQHFKGTPEKPEPIDVVAIKPDLENIIDALVGQHPLDRGKIAVMMANSIAYENDRYQNNFGPLPDPIPLRQFDSPKLRELRKQLEANEASATGTLDESSGSSPAPQDRVLSQTELEALCLAMLDELPELCYDYLGNTIVQKLFTLVESPVIKLMMVKEIAPYLTQLAIHKNGTWAIQKIINLANHDAQQMKIISDSLKPYTVKLFNDQFGNYVLQGCVKFTPPFNGFIFETILDNFLEVSFGRFGARCIRTILENGDAEYLPFEQIILIASLIVEFSNELVVNPNGSLLITWFLDTFNSDPITEGRGRSGSLGTRHRSLSNATIDPWVRDDRFALVTAKFLPNLARLCTHKLANLTILKIINNRSDLMSKQLVMDAIFGPFEEYERMLALSGDIEYPYPQPTKLLEQILQENSEHNAAGPLFIYKILSNPLALTVIDGQGQSDSRRNSRYMEFIVAQIKRILLESNNVNGQSYKKLMDEVGLPTNRIQRTNSVGGNSNRRGKRQQSTRPQGSSPAKFQQNGQQYYQGQHQQQQQQQQPQQQYPMQAGPMYQAPYGQPQVAQGYQGQPPSDVSVMKQLEQLSLSSAALGYNSNPGTPSTNHLNQFM